MTTQLARAAVWYAGRYGWHVFPLRPRTKEPFGDLGVYNATPDVEKVKSWWQRWPQANIGLHCGGSNLVALDLDTYKDTYGGDGFMSRADEETLTSLTGNGGTHLLYSVPDGKRWGNAKGNLPAGIDVKAWGGYVVLPPSIHPNGNAYQWETGYRPDEMQPLPLPESITGILDDARQPQRIVGPPDDMAVLVSLKVVDAVLDALDLATYPVQVYDKVGRRVILKECPFAPEDDPHGNDKAAYVLIARDGHISAGCLHERCRKRLNDARIGGWQFLHQWCARAYKEAA